MSENGNQDGARWEYRIIWRYGHLLLVLVGLALMACGAAGLSGTAVSATMLPLGLICLIAGVVLPRIEGKFSAGAHGLSGELAGITDLDPRFTYSITGPAVAVGLPAPAQNAGDGEESPDEPRLTVGDVWDAIDSAGLRPEWVGSGQAYFKLPSGATLGIPNRGFVDGATASDDLLQELDSSLGVRHIRASGNYPVPPLLTHYL